MCCQASTSVRQPDARAAPSRDMRLIPVGKDANPFECMMCPHCSQTIATGFLGCPISDARCFHTETGPPWVNNLWNTETRKQVGAARLVYYGITKTKTLAGKLMRGAQRRLRRRRTPESDVSTRPRQTSSNQRTTRARGAASGSARAAPDDVIQPSPRHSTPQACSAPAAAGRGPTRRRGQHNQSASVPRSSSPSPRAASRNSGGWSDRRRKVCPPRYADDRRPRAAVRANCVRLPAGARHSHRRTVSPNRPKSWDGRCSSPRVGPSSSWGHSGEDARAKAAGGRQNMRHTNAPLSSTISSVQFPPRRTHGHGQHDPQSHCSGCKSWLPR